MFDGSIACWIPRVPIQDNRTWRLSISQFGDGYQQRILDGINALETRWPLVWEMRPQADLLAMDAYLASVKGAAFPFEHPVTQIDYQVFCDEWQISWDYRRRQTGEHFGTLSAEFYVANGAAVTALP